MFNAAAIASYTSSSPTASNTTSARGPGGRHSRAGAPAGHGAVDHRSSTGGGGGGAALPAWAGTHRLGAASVRRDEDIRIFGMRDYDEDRAEIAELRPAATVGESAARRPSSPTGFRDLESVLEVRCI